MKKGSIALIGVLLFFVILAFGVNRSDLCIVNKEIKENHGASMEPLVPDGADITALINYYTCHDVKRGDFILYKYGGSKNPLLKIVRGMPGDRLSVYDDSSKGAIFLNEEVVTTSTGIPYQLSAQQIRVLKLYEGIISDNTYLILGNVSTGSTDSTSFGLVDKQDFIGKAIIK